MMGKNSSSKCQKKEAFSSEEKYILLVNEYREKEVLLHAAFFEAKGHSMMTFFCKNASCKAARQTQLLGRATTKNIH